MPLEIKELHVKITVENNGGGGASGGGGGADASSGGGGNAAGEPDEATVAACVDKVLEVLKEKSER